MWGRLTQGARAEDTSRWILKESREFWETHLVRVRSTRVRSHIHKWQNRYPSSVPSASPAPGRLQQGEEQVGGVVGEGSFVC